MPHACKGRGEPPHRRVRSPGLASSLHTRAHTHVGYVSVCVPHPGSQSRVRRPRQSRDQRPLHPRRRAPRLAGGQRHQRLPVAGPGGAPGGRGGPRAALSPPAPTSRFLFRFLFLLLGTKEGGVGSLPAPPFSCCTVRGANKAWGQGPASACFLPPLPAAAEAAARFPEAPEMGRGGPALSGSASALAEMAELLPEEPEAGPKPFRRWPSPFRKVPRPFRKCPRPSRGGPEALPEAPEAEPGLPRRFPNPVRKHPSPVRTVPRPFRKCPRPRRGGPEAARAVPEVPERVVPVAEAAGAGGDEARPGPGPGVARPSERPWRPTCTASAVSGARGEPAPGSGGPGGDWGGPGGEAGPGRAEGVPPRRRGSCREGVRGVREERGGGVPRGG